MPRRYELKKRAERQTETRRRIVEAAVALHRTKGPARTTVTDVARHAGVERHTFYRHFPNERSLLLACSGHVAAQNPAPDASAFEDIKDPEERIRAALSAVYAYYERGEDVISRVLRDVEVHEPLREIVQLRRVGPLESVRDLLARGLRRRKRALAALDVALDFHTWHRLVRTSGLSQREAVEVSIRSIFAQ